MDPYTFHVAVSLWADKTSHQEKAQAASPPPVASAPAEPGKKLDFEPVKPEPKPVRDPMYGYRPDWNKIMVPDPAPVLNKPISLQISLPVTPPVEPVEPRRWTLADSSGTLWRSEDRGWLERWIAYRNRKAARTVQVAIQPVATVQPVVQPVVQPAVQPVAQPVTWAPYWYSAGGCSGGQCGRR